MHVFHPFPLKFEIIIIINNNTIAFYFNFKAFSLNKVPPKNIYYWPKKKKKWQDLPLDNIKVLKIELNVLILCFEIKNIFIYE